MKLIITGAAGFIGSCLAEKISADNLAAEPFTRIILLDKLTYASDLARLQKTLNNIKFEFIVGDICDSDLLRKILNEGDHVINLAAESHVDRSLQNGSIFFSSNTLGVANILEVMREKNCGRFVQVSTDEVFGSIQSGFWNESSPLEPRSPYASSKASAELICRSYSISHKLDIVITRGCNTYGPNQNEEKLLPKVIKKIASNQGIPVYGDGTNIREWIHVEDHVAGIWQAFVKGESGSSYNLSGGEELTNLEIIEKVAQKMNKVPRIEFVEDRKGHDFRYAMNSSLSRQELNFYPRRNLDNTLDSIIAHYIR